MTVGDASSVHHLTHGKVNHARWYTAQSRLLSLYMATDNPTPQLALPCHTHSTERAVKLTTQVVVTVVGADREDGKALNILARRHRQQQ